MVEHVYSTCDITRFGLGKKRHCLWHGYATDKKSGESESILQHGSYMQQGNCMQHSW